MEKILHRVRAALPGIQALYLYGSTAQGLGRADSDVDLGLLLPPEGNRTALASLLGRLGTDLAMEMEQAVDLVDLRRSSTVLCQARPGSVALTWFRT